MPKKSCSDEEFIQLFQKYGPRKMATLLEIGERRIFTRRKRIEEALGVELRVPVELAAFVNQPRTGLYPDWLNINVRDGVVIVASDAHYWPGYVAPAHRALVRFAGDLGSELIALILNGDILDGADISRHPPLMGEHKPSFEEEIMAADERLDEIRAAAKAAELFWTIGNHDGRFENEIQGKAPKLAKVRGMRLQDQFPHWRHSWGVCINPEAGPKSTMVKHRFKGGIHATHNNTLWAGRTIVTGHLHSLKVTPFDDYNGTRWGVDTGTLNNPGGPHAAYTECNPLNHRSGFAFLTYRDGKLLWPELVAVVDETHVQFRGKIIEV